jgi:DNA invertase Pin-like site-specific DNA recombinase
MSENQQAEQARRKAAILERVSTEKQGGEAQGVLSAWAADRGLEVAAEHVIRVKDTAWTGRNGKGAEYDAARARLLELARLGQVQVVIVWSLDRLSRRGIKDTITVLDQFGDFGVEVWSYREPWLTTMGEAKNLIIAVLAWVAEQESRRRSERMKGSIEARKAQGRPVGRGRAPDAKPRKRSGYVAMWEQGGARRARQQERRDEKSDEK